MGCTTALLSTRISTVHFVREQPMTWLSMGRVQQRLLCLKALSRGVQRSVASITVISMPVRSRRELKFFLHIWSWSWSSTPPLEGIAEPTERRGAGTIRAAVCLLIAVAAAPSSPSRLEVAPSLTNLMDELVPGGKQLSLPRQRHQSKTKAPKAWSVKVLHWQSHGILTTLDCKVIKSSAGFNAS